MYTSCNYAPFSLGMFVILENTSFSKRPLILFFSIRFLFMNEIGTMLCFGCGARMLKER